MTVTIDGIALSDEDAQEAVQRGVNAAMFIERKLNQDKLNVEALAALNLVKRILEGRWSGQEHVPTVEAVEFNDPTAVTLATTEPVPVDVSNARAKLQANRA